MATPRPAQTVPLDADPIAIHLQAIHALAADLRGEEANVPEPGSSDPKTHLRQLLAIEAEAKSAHVGSHPELIHFLSTQRPDLLREAQIARQPPGGLWQRVLRTLGAG